VYIDDPFKAAGISDDEDSIKQESPAKGKKKRGQAEDSASDNEFVAGSGEEAEEEDPEDDPEEEPEGEYGSEADAFDPDEMEIDGIENTPRKARSGRLISHQHDPNLKKRRVDGAVAPSDDETHIRGIIEPRDHLSKGTYYHLTFGPDDRDLMPAVHFRMRWNKGIDAVFPSRFTLEETEKKPEYLYGRTFGVHPDDVMKESTRGWDWYYDRDTGERFRNRQRFETIEKSLAFQNYLPQQDTRKHGILLGPHDNQQLFQLGYHETFDFGKAWEASGPKPKESKAGSKAGIKRIREGWILNIGQKAHCMGWAPNQDGLAQYLAVAAPITDDQKNQHRSEESEPISSFQPSEPFPSALQIWEFKGKARGTPTMTLDMDSKPRLRQVLCADWGDLRRMAWCPFPRTGRVEDEEEEKESIGLLATVWGDGSIRVLDIKLGRELQETEFCGCPFRRLSRFTLMCKI
jgi:transcription factor C subunit 6